MLQHRVRTERDSGRHSRHGKQPEGEVTPIAKNAGRVDRESATERIRTHNTAPNANHNVTPSVLSTMVACNST
jgi:hypothetical protein